MVPNRLSKGDSRKEEEAIIIFLDYPHGAEGSFQQEAQAGSWKLGISEEALCTLQPTGEWKKENGERRTENGGHAAKRKWE